MGTSFQLKNVAIHAHLLPTGKVLYWGPHAPEGWVTTTFASLNEHFCSTFLWDPRRPRQQFADQGFAQTRLRRRRQSLLLRSQLSLPMGDYSWSVAISSIAKA